MAEKTLEDIVSRMRLEVPLIRQPKDSADCGIAAMTMLTQYHGCDMSFNDCKEEIRGDKKAGTYMPQLGLFLIKHGFEVTITNLLPDMFLNKEKNCSQEFVRKRLKWLNGKYLRSIDNRELGYFLKFVENGGVIEVKIPNKDDIISEIGQGRPLVALLTTDFMTYKIPCFNSHFNVITGISSSFVYANDPSWDKSGGKNKYRISDFFYGLYSNRGHLMKIKKPR